MESKRVYTKATERLKRLHKEYGGLKSGNPEKAEWFDNTDAEWESGNFYAEERDNPVWYNEERMNFQELSEEEFISFMGLDNVKNVFNPQSHYDNSNGSLYKIANQLGLNHWEFDVFKRLVRCRKKNQFEQDLKKIKDTIDIYLKEYK